MKRSFGALSIAAAFTSTSATRIASVSSSAARSSSAAPAAVTCQSSPSFEETKSPIPTGFRCDGNRASRRTGTPYPVPSGGRRAPEVCAEQHGRRTKLGHLAGPNDRPASEDVDHIGGGEYVRDVLLHPDDGSSFFGVEVAERRS